MHAIMILVMIIFYLLIVSGFMNQSYLENMDKEKIECTMNEKEIGCKKVAKK